MTGSEANAVTRLAYLLGVPVAANVERQWPQMGEVVRTRELVARVRSSTGRRMRP